MPPLTHDALTRALKNGELQPVYYLHGPEDVLKEEAVTNLIDRALDRRSGTSTSTSVPSASSTPRVCIPCWKRSP
jgi:DNA polymerase III delta subunit